MRSKALLLWIPAVLVGTMAVVEARMSASRAHVGRVHESQVACHARAISADVDGDGRPEQLRVVRANDDETWVDVWHNGALRSSTRLGTWNRGAEIDPVDVNGDGRIDLVRRWHDASGDRTQVWLSDGSAFEDGGAQVAAETRVAQR